ncbi:MAG: FkbM family methyltransferase [Verrucomicrobia bacterium]|nr:FkbM family methyltransferase [Verrucomicrobiota bacterium]
MDNTPHRFLASRALGRVLADLRFKCLDIGARQGITRDLLPIASAVDACGFEPDPTECQRLNERAAAEPGPWRSLRFASAALGAERGQRTLHLYRARGGSSLLEADLEIARQFARTENFICDGTVEVQTVPLDEAAREYDLEDAVFLKLDIQGAELEVLRSGPRLVGESLLALRAEVEFIPVYQGQPVFADVDALLRSAGFVAMGFVEMRHWRRTTRRRITFAKGPLPYSRGQLAHADVIYFRNPDSLRDDTPAAVERLLQAAFLALTYDCVDHAQAIFARPAVREYLLAKYGVAAEAELAKVSRSLAWRRWWDQSLDTAGRVAESAGQGLCLLVRRPLRVMGPWQRM